MPRKGHLHAGGAQAARDDSMPHYVPMVHTLWHLNTPLAAAALTRLVLPVLLPVNDVHQLGVDLRQGRIEDLGPLHAAEGGSQ